MHHLRVTMAVASLALVAACGDSEQPDRPAAQPRPSPVTTSSASASSLPTGGRTLTSRDNGSVVVLDAGESADLVIRDPLAPDPVLAGTAITLIEVSNVTESGVREWEVQAVEPGRAELRAEENGKPLILTFEVR